MINKKDFPQITIITVTFNLIKNGREAFFRQNLESVHNQTYPNIEHLIVDGASTDGTLDILKEYADKGWIRYISEPDSGVGDAMNKGIKMASSDYIAILNSDDYYDVDAIETMVTNLLENDADYVYSSTHLLNADGTTYGHWKTNKWTPVLFFIYCPFNHETMLCKKSVYNALDADGYYLHWREYGTACDFEFLLRLMSSDFKPVRLEKEYFHFRLGGNTSPNSKRLTEIQKKHMRAHYKVVVDFWKQWLSSEELTRVQERFLNREDLPDEHEFTTFITTSFVLDCWYFMKSKNLRYYNYDLLKQFLGNILFQKKGYGRYTIYLFNIPLIKIKKRGVKQFVRLLGIPLLKIKEKKNKKTYYLFNTVPLLKIKSKG